MLTKDSDRSAVTAKAALMMHGKLLYLPQKLIDVLGNFSPRRDGQEAVALCYGLVNHRQNHDEREKKRKRKHKEVWIHTDCFAGVAGSRTTTTRAKNFLIENKFLWMSPYYLQERYPKSYKIMGHSNKGEYVLHTNKSIYDICTRKTDSDIACEITRRYSDMLECDYPAATEIFADGLWDHINGVSGRVSLEDRKKLEIARKKPHTPSERDLWSIPLPFGQIEHQCGRIKRGEKGKRLFSPVANMDKRLRRCLSYDNRRLVEIDMVSCQPTLLGHLANDKMLIGDCIANNFYERLMEVLNRERPKDKWLIRDDVKEFFCAWNFGSTKRLAGSSRYPHGSRKDR